MLYSTTSVMYASMIENPADTHSSDACEVVSRYCFNLATIRYFDTHKVLMLEKMEEATTDGERIGYAENINLLGNFKQQAEQLDTLYVLNMKQKYPTAYNAIACDVVVVEESIEHFTHIIDPEFKLENPTSIHYNRLYRGVEDMGHGYFMSLVDRNICSTMGAESREITDEDMSQYNIMENLFR